MSPAELISEYAELEKQARELNKELRCRHDCIGLCITPEVLEARQKIIEITFRMDDINECLGRDKKPSYHRPE